MGTCVGGTVLTIVTEKMASKTFGQRTCRSRMKGTRARKYLSG